MKKIGAYFSNLQIQMKKYRKTASLLLLLAIITLPYQNCGKFESATPPMGDTSSVLGSGDPTQPTTDAAAALEAKRAACRALMGTPTIAFTGATSANINSGMAGNAGDSSGQIPLSVNKGINDVAQAQTLICAQNTQIQMNVVVDAAHPMNITQAVAMDGTIMTSAALADDNARKSLGDRALGNGNNMNDGNYVPTFTANANIQSERNAQNNPVRCVQGTFWVSYRAQTNMENQNYNSSLIYSQITMNDSCWNERKLSTQGAALLKGAAYGYSVSNDGAWSAVVAQKDNSSTGVVGAGSLSIFNNGNFVSRIYVPGAATNDNLQIVKIKGNVLAVSSIGKNAEEGAVFIYRYDGANWVYDQTLTPPNPQAGQNFGYALSLSGGYLAVGAPNYSVSGTPRSDTSGRVYVFQDNGSTFNFVNSASIPNADGKGFGRAVEISGSNMAVGAPQAITKEGMGKGEVHIFSLTNLTTPIKSIASTINTDGAEFGASVALSGNRLAVGAPGIRILDAATGSQVPSGAVVYYTDFNQAAKASITINQQAKLGQALAFTGDGLLAGMPYITVNGSQRAGAVDFFRFTTLDAGQTTLGFRLMSYQNSPSDLVGWSVSASGNQVAVGGYNKSNPNNGEGAAFVYSKK